MNIRKIICQVIIVPDTQGCYCERLLTPGGNGQANGAKVGKEGEEKMVINSYKQLIRVCSDVCLDVRHVLNILQLK